MPIKSRSRSSSSRPSSSRQSAQSRPAKSSSSASSRSSSSSSRSSSSSSGSFFSSRGSSFRRGSGGGRTALTGPIGIVIAVVILAVLALVWFMTRNQNQTPPADTSALPDEVSVQEAYDMYQDGAVLVDVREQDEWDDFHFDGAVFIPQNDLGSRLSELPKDKDIVVICRTGRRSAESRDLLRSLGYERVTSVAGGFFDWSEAGLPLTGNRP